jgi:hypothetical protein
MPGSGSPAAALGRPALALACALLAACASTSPGPGGFAFGVMGDTQYHPDGEAAFIDMMREVDRADLAFVVHVGDFMGGAECSDALYARRKAEFDASAHPFIYTPGDNEWADCRGRGRDPLERLAKLREVFFADARSLGRSKLDLFVQKQCVEGEPQACVCMPLPENRFWTRAGVRFVTLHVTGSENNAGVNGLLDEEVRCRNAANRAWLEQAIRISERSETVALVIFMQANPFYTRRDAYRGVVRQVEEAARRIKTPVLLVHGDTHSQRIDNPFMDNLGNPLPRHTRLEVFGNPFTGWIRVVVDPEDPTVFKFEPRLVRITGIR